MYVVLFTWCLLPNIMNIPNSIFQRSDYVYPRYYQNDITFNSEFTV